MYLNQVSDERDISNRCRKRYYNKRVTDEETNARFKELEKIILPFLYNLSKSDGFIYISANRVRL